MTDKPLRVWWIPQIPMPSFIVPVADLEAAHLILDVLAAYDAFQFENGVKGDYCNVGGLSIFEDGEWCDWEDEDGSHFDEVRHDLFPPVKTGVEA